MDMKLWQGACPFKKNRRKIIGNENTTAFHRKFNRELLLSGWCELGKCYSLMAIDFFKKQSFIGYNCEERDHLPEY